MASTRGRQVVVLLTNKTGGGVVAGDVVVLDSANDTAFKTTTTGQAEVSVGVVQDTIANNATGRVLVSGYAALVNVPASVTRGHYVETHTVAKQATGNSTRRAGSFGTFLTGGTTPTALIWGDADQTASGGGSGSITASGYTQNTAKMLGRTTASSGAIEEITVGTGLSLSAGSLTATGGSGGALVFLEAHTASSSSSLDFTTFISSTYDDYVIEVVDLAPASNGVQIHIEVGTGGGPTYDTGNTYEWGRSGITSGGGAANDSGTTGLPRLFQNISNNAAYGYGFATLRVSNLQSTAHRKTFVGTINYVSSDPLNVFATWGMQWTTSGTAATALRFIASSGNIASGTIRIYGISKT